MSYIIDATVNALSNHLFEPIIKLIEALALSIAMLIGLKELFATRLEKSWEFVEKFDREWDSKEYKEARSVIAKYIIECKALQQSIDLNSTHINSYTIKILDFFEMIGLIHRAGGLNTHFAWSIWSDYLFAHQEYIEAAIKKQRVYEKNESNVRRPGDEYYEECEFLLNDLKKYTKKRNGYFLSKDDALEEIKSNLFIVYRTIKPNDFKQIWEIERIKFDKEATLLTQEEIELYGTKFPQQMFVCESLHDGIIGYALCTMILNTAVKFDTSDFSIDQTAEIVSFSVIPSYHNLGIEKELIELIEDNSKLYDVNNLVLVLPESQRKEIDFFVSLNFTEHSSLSDHYKEGSHGIILSKHLSAPTEILRLSAKV